MGKIDTKYSVGDKVFIIDSRGIGHEYIRVILEEVRGIKITSRSGIEYEFRTMTRDQRDIYTNLADARKAARNKAKDRYEKNLDIIEDEKPGAAYIQEAE